MLSKFIYQTGGTPGLLILQSSIIALILLTIYTLCARYKELKKTPIKTIRILLAANVIRTIGEILSETGIALTFMVNAGFLVKFTFVTTILFGWLMLKEKLTTSKVAIMLVMFTCNLLITTKGQMVVPQTGDLLILAACFCWSFSSALIRRVLKDKPVNSDISTFTRPFAAIATLSVVIVVSRIAPGAITEPFNVNVFDITHLPFTIVYGIAISAMWLFLNRSFKVAGLSYFAMMTMLTPIIVTAGATLLFGEKLVPVQIFSGIVIILSGIYVHVSKMCDS